MGDEPRCVAWLIQGVGRSRGTVMWLPVRGTRGVFDFTLSAGTATAGEYLQLFCVNSKCIQRNAARTCNAFDAARNCDAIQHAARNCDAIQHAACNCIRLWDFAGGGERELSRR